MYNVLIAKRGEKTMTFQFTGTAPEPEINSFNNAHDCSMHAQNWAVFGRFKYNTTAPFRKVLGIVIVQKVFFYISFNNVTAIHEIEKYYIS